MLTFRIQKKNVNFFFLKKVIFIIIKAEKVTVWKPVWKQRRDVATFGGGKLTTNAGAVEVQRDSTAVVHLPCMRRTQDRQWFDSQHSHIPNTLSLSGAIYEWKVRSSL